MMKRMLALLMILALLPLTALAGADTPLVYERTEKKFINFPTMDEWRGHFGSVTKWIIVTPETLDENWELVSGRGDPEEEIRARYADENFLFEAYSPDLPEDACFRAEVFENEITREIWHLRHWNTAERKQINEFLASGKMLPDREMYSITNAETGTNAHVRGYFTNYPPATHESGKLQIHFRNGRMYVFSYCVTGRLAGAKRWYTAKEEAAIAKTPVDTSTESKFLSEALPRMPLYKLESVMPDLIAPGTVTVKGTVDAGSTFVASVDGKEVSAQVDKKGNFTVELPLTEVGERHIVFTVSHAKYTTRTMEYKVNVSDTATPLTITGEPGVLSAIDSVTLAGLSAPGAEITITLDEGKTSSTTAGSDGQFRHVFTVDGRGVYSLKVSAAVEGKEETVREFVFGADYEDADTGIKAFNEEVTDVNFKTICENVEDYIGTKVKISIRTKEITINEQGLGLLSVYNAPSGKEKDQTPLYVNLPGYAQCQIGEKMIITIYATVDGKRVLFTEDGEEEERIELTVDYGTYLVGN